MTPLSLPQRIAAQSRLTAAVLGTQAFKNGKKCVPAQDAEFCALIGSTSEELRALKVSEPERRALTIRLLDDWLEAWHAANLANN